ncbi:immunoglobulin domain-containing protein, partial [Euzebya tangerina]|uniref:immunoglobulin domain-containing protein n=1 Tax=Euzebya tangerina TaxID=591198 RepID=UPI002F322EDC
LPDDPDPDSGLVQYQRLTTTETSLSFQWRKDDADIPGATEQVYVLESALPGDTGDYEAVVTNDCGSTISDAAAVIVAEAQPIIVQQPTDQAACVGEPVTFTVVAEGGGLSYQWRKDDAEIEGATEPAYTIDQVSGADQGQYDVLVSNGCGTITSAAATLSVASAAPSITQQPTDQAACDGASATFTVVAEGDWLSYQWWKDNEEIPGATESWYTIDPVSSLDEGYYEVLVSNACGSVASDLAILTVVELGPTITQQPGDVDTCEGASATFTVAADGEELSYQWRKGGQDIPGATEPSYTIDPVSDADEGTYDVVVTNPCDSLVSDSAELTVDTGPTITEHPVGQSACEGGQVTFTVTAEGEGISYQWRKDDEDIPGATGPSYTIDPVSPADAGDYDVLVSNDCGTVASDTAMLTVISGGPTITEHPVSQTVCEGVQVTFTVTAEGDELGYQWRKNGQDIPDATDASYTIASAIVDDAGNYDVVVGNACGEVTSDAATLVVDEWPSITQQPADQTGCVGDAATFSVMAEGTEPLSYQWRKNGQDVPGATSDTYTIDPLAYEDAGNYDVVVTNDCGSVASETVLLTVGTGAQIDVQPSSQTACEGDVAQFEVEASGGAAVENTIGTASSSGTASRVRGNYYSVSSTTTLTRIEHYLNITTSGLLVFFVYEAEATDGPYTLIAEDRVADAGTGPGFYASAPLDVTLQAGKYYIIGAGWPGSHTYYWGGSHPQTTTFGQSLYGYAGPYQD